MKAQLRPSQQQAAAPSQAPSRAEKVTAERRHGHLLLGEGDLLGAPKEVLISFHSYTRSQELRKAEMITNPGGAFHTHFL